MSVSIIIKCRELLVADGVAAGRGPAAAAGVCP